MRSSPTRRSACLEAHAAGLELIVERLARWTAADPASADDDPRAAVRGAVVAYLVLAADEPEFARCMLIELPAIAPAGLDARLAAHRQIATLLRAWHHQAREEHPDWPAVPDGRYPAAIGAVHDLLFDAVASGDAERAPSLCDDAVGAVLTLLEVPSGP